MYSYYQKYLIIFIIFIGNTIFPNYIYQDYTISNLRKYEINSVQEGEISNFLYDFSNIPVLSNSKNISYNFLKNLKNITINPVLGLRFSSSGFEMNPLEIPGQSIWLTPGLQFNLITPIISPYSGFMFQAWGSFYKHSAYFLDKSKINNNSLKTNELKPFEYHPYLSLEYFVQSKEPNWGVDFDEAQGGLGIFTKNLNINFGKFKSSFGPFHRGNLSLSLKTPSFPQLKLNYKGNYKNKNIFDFTYIIGDLISEIADSNISTAYIKEGFEIHTRLPWIKRGIIYHRIDLHLSKTIRISFYEKLIYGARQTPWQYLIPINFYWSAQHATGDFDNLQIGFDLDWIHHNGRTNFALLVDEWAPFKTLNSKEHHNWFGIQLGHSQIFNFLQRKFYFRFENALISPQIYEHKFPINQSYNQGYPIGFWTKGDAADFWFVLTLINDNKFNPRIELEYTIFGEPQYGTSHRFLKNSTSERMKSSMIMNYQMKEYSNIEIQLSYFNTKKLEYNQNKFFDFTINYKYNISY